MMIKCSSSQHQALNRARSPTSKSTACIKNHIIPYYIYTYLYNCIVYLTHIVVVGRRMKTTTQRNKPYSCTLKTENFALLYGVWTFPLLQRAASPNIDPPISVSASVCKCRGSW
jgi:hypothetical protein